MASPRVLNDLFTTKLSEPGGTEKIAAYTGGYIRDRLREVSFADGVIPPKTVTPDECQVSTRHDTLVKIEEIEPESRAMVVNFRGQPRARYIQAERAEVAFSTISSEQYQKTEEELLAYTMPITKIIEENVVLDMQEVKDRGFITHVEAAVQLLQMEANGGAVTTLNATALAGAVPPAEVSVRKGELARVAATDDATVRPIQRRDLVNGFNMLVGNRLRCKVVLMTETESNDMLSWTVEDMGDKNQSETMYEGMPGNKMLGRQIVRTIKTDILRRGNVYFFTDPEFLGRSYILNQPKFYIDKVANVITFQAWMTVATAIINVAAARKLELYSGDATSLDADGIIAAVTPVDMDDLGIVNNRVADRGFFPTVSLS